MTTEGGFFSLDHHINYLETDFDPTLNSIIIKSVLDGISHIHKNKIVHRDISLKSIFLKDNRIVKIGKFSEADYEDYDGKVYGKLVDEMVRPPEMMSREILPYTNKIDIWAVGELMFRIMTGKHATAFKNMSIF